MKRNKHKGSLATLLAKNYLAFTLALIVIFLGNHWIWNTWVTEKLMRPDINGLVQSPEFLSAQYKNVNVERYLGEGSAFSVLDDTMQVRYQSSKDLPLIHTKEELEYVPSYDAKYYTDSVYFRTKDGKSRTLLIRNYLNTTQPTDADIILLDENFHVLEGEFEPGKTTYTQNEVFYLTGQWANHYTLMRYSTVSRKGETLSVLFCIPDYNQTYYDHVMTEGNRIWLLIIPLYIVVALIFITLLNRDIRHPLQKLNASILCLGRGELVNATNCGGPKELQVLGQSFDDMAYKLAESEDERRRLEQQRQKLLTDISHDLKTPITVLSGYIGAIQDGKIPPEELTNYLQIIQSKAESLAELIDSFHEYSKTEHPDFRLHCEATDVCEFLRAYLAEKYAEIDLAGFSLEVQIPESRLVYPLDRFQMRRALDNILANALKHNRLGTLIRITLLQKENGIAIYLADNGSGIPMSIREDLFRPFVVGDESRSSGGSGLGLAIAKKIIEAHGGEISLVEMPKMKRGTEFALFFPL